MPKVDKKAVPAHERLAYPGRLLERSRGCFKQSLASAAGLTQFGLGETVLQPGASTGLYHWHEREDEFVYVLAGEVVMIEGSEETVLQAGDCAGFPAGVRLAHTFENRSDSPARLLEVGHRSEDGDTAYYPGYDQVYRRQPPSEGYGYHFETHDGRRLSPDDEVARLENDPDNLKPPSTLDIP